MMRDFLLFGEDDLMGQGTVVRLDSLLPRIVSSDAGGYQNSKVVCQIEMNDKCSGQLGNKYIDE